MKTIVHSFPRLPVFGMVLYLASQLTSCAQPNDVDARKALEAAIADDSSGAIILKRFSKLEETHGEEEGRKFVRSEYKAELEFQESGVWQFYPPAEKLSFHLNVPPNFASGPGGNVAKMIAESKWYEANTGVTVKRGSRRTITGYFVFALPNGQWTVAKNQFDLSMDPNPWMLPEESSTDAKAAVSPSPRLTQKQETDIKNNLRQLSAAADFTYLESGKATAKYDDIVGPTRLVISVKSIAGEDYSALTFERGKPLTVTTPGGQKVTYGGQ